MKQINARRFPSNMSKHLHNLRLKKRAVFLTNRSFSRIRIIKLLTKSTGRKWHVCDKNNLAMETGLFSCVFCSDFNKNWLCESVKLFPLQTRCRSKGYFNTQQKFISIFKRRYLKLNISFDLRYFGDAYEQNLIFFD